VRRAVPREALWDCLAVVGFGCFGTLQVSACIWCTMTSSASSALPSAASAVAAAGNADVFQPCMFV